jgi:long-chain acyl-CoA synthetase
MKPTIHFDVEITSSAECFHRYQSAAAALHECGIGERDVFALMLHNEPVMLELTLAGRWLGARWCLINWHFKTQEVRHLLTDSTAKVLIIHADLLQAIGDAIPRGIKVFVVMPAAHTRRVAGIDDGEWRLATGFDRWEEFRDAGPRPAIAQKAPGTAMFYTSGTTGMPKGILRAVPSPEQVQAMQQMNRIALGIEPGIRTLVSAPLYHAAPMGYALFAALNEATLWIEPRFDAERTLQLIEAHRITHTYMVATMFVRLLALPAEVRDRYDLSSLKFVASTGSPCAPEVKRRMIEWWGPVIHESYAASELGYVTHIDSHEALRKPGSAGRAMPGVTLDVLSEDGVQLPSGRIGIIYARHAAVPDFTYSQNDEARHKLETNGLWTLGNMGYLDEDGYLFIVDRRTDMVISGGVNIYPAEIEAALIAMPGVADCAAFGIPDDEFGEALVAAVQPSPGAALMAQEVQTFLRERIAHYKVPRLVTFHTELPREDSGKIFKRKLRDPYWAGRTRRV